MAVCDSKRRLPKKVDYKDNNESPCSSFDCRVSFDHLNRKHISNQLAEDR